MKPLTERDLEELVKGIHNGKLVDHGFLYRVGVGFELTLAGREAVEAWRQLKDGTKLAPGRAQKWGHTIPTSTRVPLTEEDRKSLRLKCRLELP